MTIPEEYIDQRVGLTGYRVVGLDLDGVCADYTAGLQQYMVNHGYPDALSYPPPDQYNLVKATGWPFASFKEYQSLHRAAVADHLYRDLPVLPGASEALHRISEAEVHIRIVTHRLFIGGHHQTIVTDTAAWLEQHKIPYMSLCFTGLKDSISASLYVEDSPRNIEELRSSKQHCVIFDQPYNQALLGPRIVNWSEGAEVVLSELNQIRSK